MNRKAIMAPNAAIKWPQMTAMSFTAEEELERLHLDEQEQLQKVQVTEKLTLLKYHRNIFQKTECGSTLIQKINAPVEVVWGILASFENPQSYSNFVKSCSLVSGDGSPGSVREVKMISGLPVTTSIEKLEVLDKENHVCRLKGSLFLTQFTKVGRNASHENEATRESPEDSWKDSPRQYMEQVEILQANYTAIFSVHERIVDEQRKALAIQSYVTEVPDGVTTIGTRITVDFMVRTILRSLAWTAERALLLRRPEFHSVKSCSF
jgi:abscisic acid receptor (PYR/PYL family)